MTAALIVLLLLLLLFGGGGLAMGAHLLWYVLVIGLVLWAIGFVFRTAEGGGRWYYW